MAPEAQSYRTSESLGQMSVAPRPTPLAADLKWGQPLLPAKGEVGGPGENWLGKAAEAYGSAEDATY